MRTQRPLQKQPPNRYDSHEHENYLQRSSGKRSVGLPSSRHESAKFYTTEQTRPSCSTASTRPVVLTPRVQSPSPQHRSLQQLCRSRSDADWVTTYAVVKQLNVCAKRRTVHAFPNKTILLASSHNSNKTIVYFPITINSVFTQFILAWGSEA